LKRVIKYTLLILLLLIAIFAIQNYPVSSDAKNLTRLSDTTNIRKNLKSIINTADYRNYKNIEVLDTVAERVRMEFLKHTHRVTVQNYKVKENNYKNIIASFGPEDGERIIVGAHYDVCRDQDGADDNASGVAGILELARLLKDQQLKYRIDLVAYTLEEPPYFNTKQMGSYVHAKSLHDANIPVKGMISLEMIGYYSDKENSQGYPIGIMKWIYGDKGNFITIVQKSFCGQFAKEFKKVSFQNNSITTKSFRTPSFLGGANLSDHKNYWEFGYSAVMVTNTAFFRNHNYHTKLDTLEALNIPKMGLTIDGVFRTLLHLK
jgi:Zn-dependent M28 family amino/carboxypeptidase